MRSVVFSFFTGLCLFSNSFVYANQSFTFKDSFAQSIISTALQSGYKLVPSKNASRGVYELILKNINCSVKTILH